MPVLCIMMLAQLALQVNAASRSSVTVQFTRGVMNEETNIEALTPALG